MNGHGFSFHSLAFTDTLGGLLFDNGYDEICISLLHT